MSNIETTYNKLTEVLAMLEKNRQCGNTTAIARGVKITNDAVVLTSTAVQARRLKDVYGVQAFDIAAFIRKQLGTVRKVPVVLDGATVVDLLTQATQALAEAMAERQPS